MTDLEMLRAGYIVMCGIAAFFVFLFWNANVFEGQRPWRAVLVSLLIIVLWPLDVLCIFGYVVWETVMWLVRNEPIKHREPSDDIGL